MGNFKQFDFPNLFPFEDGQQFNRKEPNYSQDWAAILQNLLKFTLRKHWEISNHNGIFILIMMIEMIVMIVMFMVFSQLFKLEIFVVIISKW